MEPLMRHRPKGITEEDFLNVLFNTHCRVLTTYYVKYNFRMLGLYCVNDTIPTQGLGDHLRQIKRHDKIMARVDDRHKDIIHVDHQGHVFLLNPSEWSLIRGNLVMRPFSEEI
jgi:hypothetical protein